jgi:hypothetical protein
MELGTQQFKRIDGICEYLKDYMDVRFGHAARVNPHIAHVYDDVAWQELTTVRQVLSATKAYGPVRYFVVDILCSDDKAKVWSLFNPVDQNSIMNEVIDEKESKRDQRAGILEIGSMRTLYRALDPSLERILEIIQTWLWWDLMDGALLFNFEQQLQRLQQLKTHEITDKLEEYYHKALRRALSEAVSKQEIMEFEFKKLESIVTQFAQRRHEDEGYKIIIKRDELPESEINGQIKELSEHIGALERLEAAHALGEEMRKRYAALLECALEEVTLERAREYERKHVESRKKDMMARLARPKHIGQPYDYKQTQLDHLRRRFEEARKSFLPEQAAVPEAKQAEAS